MWSRSTTRRARSPRSRRLRRRPTRASACSTGVQKALGMLDRPPEDISMLLHGSTVATNAVLEHKFDGLGPARHARLPAHDRDRPPVRAGRLRQFVLLGEAAAPGAAASRPRGAGADALRRLGDRARRRGRRRSSAVRELVEDGVRCIAVCLLHSYANGEHEQAVGELIRENFPDVFVSLSSVVLPEYREYERAMTTLIDVLVKPVLQDLSAKRRGQDPRQVGRHSVPDHAVERRRREAFHRRRAAGDHAPLRACGGHPRLDPHGRARRLQEHPHHRRRRHLDRRRHHRGPTSRCTPRPRMVESYPVKTPMLDIVTVGSGGGSIAWTDPYGNLKVGPQSAGADPGPDLLSARAARSRPSPMRQSCSAACRRR